MELRKFKDVVPPMYQTKEDNTLDSDYGFFYNDTNVKWVWAEYFKAINKGDLAGYHILRQMSLQLYNKISERYISSIVDYADRYPLVSPIRNNTPGEPGLLKKTIDDYISNPWGNPQWKFLRNHIMVKYNDKWTHELELLKLKYDPIANYDRTEETTISGSGTDTRTDNLKEDITRNNTATKNDSISSKDDSTVQKDNSANSTNSETVYAFNDATGSPSNKTENSGKGQETITDASTGSSTITGTSTVNDKEGKTNTGTVSNQSTSSTTTTSKIKGNIGVTTTQQMIKSEIELWTWNFLNGVIDDVAKELTLTIYD